MVDRINIENLSISDINFPQNESGTETDKGVGQKLSQALSRAGLKKQAYQLGERRGNTRTIDTNSVQMYGGGSTKIVRGPGGQNIRIPVPGNDASTADGYIGDSAQDRRGDCYFLAEINAIRNTKGGQALLHQNCRKNNDGSYTVTLPGAIKIRNYYEKKGLKTPITGTYHITKETLNKAGNSRMYSKGDLEVVAYELAMESYRAEMYLTQKKFGKPNDCTTADGQPIGWKDNKPGDVLSSGFTWDAGYLLTGKKSDVYTAGDKKYNKAKPYKDGQYGYITREEMARRTGADVSMYKSASLSEVSHYTQREQALNTKLDQYTGKEGQYAITFGCRVAKDGPDGVTKAGGGHALTVVKITKDTVYVANPWHPEKIEPIPRDEFLKMATSLQAMPVDNNTSTSGNGFNLNGILNILKRNK